jgi:acyl carrier protein
MNDPDLPAKIKQMLVESLMLKISPEEIGDDSPLFGPEGLGLDSIDALELSVAVEKQFGAPVPNSEVARKAFASVSALAGHIEETAGRA